MKPGRVSWAERAAPPIVSFAATSRVDRPARASVMAADSPLGPAPTTTASYAGAVMASDMSMGARKRDGSDGSGWGARDGTTEGPDAPTERTRYGGSSREGTRWCWR